MGFFDRFRKNNKKDLNIVSNNNQTIQPKSNIEYNSTSDGNLQIEFYDDTANFASFYDTTRLIIEKTDNIDGHIVYKGSVSWYKEDDCIMFNEETEKLDRDSTDIRLEIDLNLLQNDSNYCSYVMKNLLDKQRVHKYLEKGLQEAPDLPCGNYIGGVKETENGYGYKNFFSPTVGKYIHNLEDVRNERQKHRNKLEMQKQKAIANKQAQIEKLQKEIDSMER